MKLISKLKNKRGFVVEEEFEVPDVRAIDIMEAGKRVSLLFAISQSGFPPSEYVIALEAQCEKSLADMARKGATIDLDEWNTLTEKVVRQRLAKKSVLDMT